MILGIGIDLVDLNRIKELSSDRFISRILSDEEKKQIDDFNIELEKLEGKKMVKKEKKSKENLIEKKKNDNENNSQTGCKPIEVPTIFGVR